MDLNYWQILGGIGIFLFGIQMLENSLKNLMSRRFKLFLKKQGFTRIVVGTGKEALAALHKQKFDICFLDLQLPDITGDEIYKQAKILHPELPIVIITGYPDSQMLDNILKHGPVTVLKKPLEVELLQQVLKMLGHEVKAKAA